MRQFSCTLLPFYTWAFGDLSLQPKSLERSWCYLWLNSPFPWHFSVSAPYFHIPYWQWLPFVMDAEHTDLTVFILPRWWKFLRRLTHLKSYSPWGFFDSVLRLLFMCSFMGVWNGVCNTGIASSKFPWNVSLFYHYGVACLLVLLLFFFFWCS